MSSGHVLRRPPLALARRWQHLHSVTRWRACRLGQFLAARRQRQARAQRGPQRGKPRFEGKIDAKGVLVVAQTNGYQRRAAELLHASMQALCREAKFGVGRVTQPKACVEHAPERSMWQILAQQELPEPAHRVGHLALARR